LPDEFDQAAPTSREAAKLECENKLDLGKETG